VTTHYRVIGGKVEKADCRCRHELMSRLSGRTAIVTGGAGGIGRAIAERFATEGANVAVSGPSVDRVRAAAEAIEREIDGARTTGIAADVAEYGDVERLVQETLAQFGRLDVMVNGVSVSTAGPAEEIGPAEWREVIEVDLTGTFFGAQVAAKRMIEQGDGGAILNVSSMMREAGLARHAPCGAASGGVDSLTRALAVEWADHDITVNALAPGFVADVDGRGRAEGPSDGELRERTRMARCGSLEEIAACALFLVAGDTSVTVQVLDADGGRSADLRRNADGRGE
jgi:3-oxoacyl-[acyl-carrier protein] reductase